MFVEIDRTTSTLGRDALYHRLHTLGSAEDVGEFEALVTFFSRNVDARERAQLALTRLQDPNGYNVWWLGDPDAVPRRSWHTIFPCLTLLTIAAIGATILWHAMGPLLVAVLIADIYAPYVARKEITAYGVALRQIAPIVAAGEDLSFLPDAGLVRLGRVRDDAAALRRLKTVSRWLSGDPMMLSFNGVGTLITTALNLVYAYANIALLLDANGMVLAGSDLRRQRAALFGLVAAIGEVDAALSVASWRAEQTQWTRPTFVAGTAMIRLDEIRHPLVTDAVPNTLMLAPGRGMLITGSNMSGKSTFLRTVGVNAVLAQRLNTCLAAAYGAPFFAVRSCIGKADDLMSGKSYYLAEVEVVLALVQASERAEPHLFLFDELFRGTNTVERVSAAQSVLTALVEQEERPRPHVVLSATHDAELIEMLRERYEPFHFSDRVGADGLEFDFLLEPGPSTTRNAIALLAQRGASTRIVERALATAAALDAQRRMAS